MQDASKPQDRVKVINIVRQTGLDESAALYLLNEHDGDGGAAIKSFTRETKRADAKALDISSAMTVEAGGQTDLTYLRTSRGIIEARLADAATAGEQHIAVTEAAGNIHSLIRINSILAVKALDLDNDEHVDAMP